MPCWCWLDLSFNLFLLLGYHFGSEYAFEPHFQLSSFSMLWFLCSQSTWTELALGAIKDQMHLRDAWDAWQLLTGVWFLSQKKACWEYMALPHPKVCILYTKYIYIYTIYIYNVYIYNVYIYIHFGWQVLSSDDFAVQVWSYQIMTFAVENTPWFSLWQLLGNVVRGVASSSLLHCWTLARRKPGAGWMKCFGCQTQPGFHCLESY